MGGLKRGGGGVSGFVLPCLVAENWQNLQNLHNEINNRKTLQEGWPTEGEESAGKKCKGAREVEKYAGREGAWLLQHGERSKN